MILLQWNRFSIFLSISPRIQPVPGAGAHQTADYVGKLRYIVIDKQALKNLLPEEYQGYQDKGQRDLSIFKAAEAGKKDKREDHAACAA